MTKTATKPSKATTPKPDMAKLPTNPRVRKASASKPAAPLLAKALNASTMSPSTADLLTNPAWQPGEVSALQYIPVVEVFPAFDNPRANLGDLTGLAASITAVGILEPILVRPSPSPFVPKRGPAYQIVAGHRRHAAAILAGLDLIPCIVRTFTEQARIEAMVIENLQRSDLSPFDEARGLTQLVNVGLTQRDIAERVGCSQSHVSKRLALVALPAAAETLFVEEKLAIRHVEELAKVPDSDIVGIVDLLVTRAKSYKDTLIPDWAIDNEIANLKRNRKHSEAVKAGKASGLQRLKDQPYEYHGSAHRKCKKSDATHWYLGQHDTTVVWARTAAAHAAANPVAAKDDRPMSEWELRNEAAKRIEAFIDEAILPAVHRDIFARAVFIASVTAATRQALDDRGVTAQPLDQEFTDALGTDDELHVSLALLYGLAGWSWRLPVLEIFIAHGYRTTGVGETFPEGFDTTRVLIATAAS